MTEIERAELIAEAQAMLEVAEEGVLRASEELRSFRKEQRRLLKLLDKLKYGRQ